MKKIKFLIFTFVMLFAVNTNVFATTYTKEVTDYEGKTEYKMSVKLGESEPSNLELRAEGMQDFTFLSNTANIYSDYLYSYYFTDSSQMLVNNITGPVEILIEKDKLKEGTIYDVYYFEKDGWPKVMDTSTTTTATVVKIDGKLYIKFTATLLKPFALNMRASNEFKAAINELMPTGIYTFPSVKPTRTIEDGFDFYTLFAAFNSDKHGFELWPADEYDKNKAFQYMTIGFDNIKGEKHIVKYTWQDSNQKVLTKIEELEKEIIKNTRSLEELGGPGDGIFFEIADLNYINYLYNTKTDSHMDAVNYSSELKKILKNSNFKYYFDFRAGDDTLFSNLAFGYMSLSYDGVIYPLSFDAGYFIKQVIYIPSDTPDTNEEYIKAAKKRICEYLGIDDVVIEVGGLRSSLLEDIPELNDIWDNHYDVSNMSDYYYNVTINGKTVKFVFEKNSDMIKDIEFKTLDLLTDIEINTKSGELPLDSSIKANELSKDSTEFKELLKKLNKEYGNIFDLELFSNSLNKNITKLKSGEFEVRIPLKEEFKGKKLSAFYLGDNDKIEEYPITIVGDYGMFRTTHFSTYTIAEATVPSIPNETETPNPNTLDNINVYIILGTISFIGIALISYRVLKKRNNY